MSDNFIFTLVPEWVMVFVAFLAASHWLMLWRVSKKTLYLVMAGPVFMMALYYLSVPLDRDIISAIWLARLGTIAIFVTMMLLARQLMRDIRKQKRQIAAQHNGINGHHSHHSSTVTLSKPLSNGSHERQPATHQH